MGGKYLRKNIISILIIVCIFLGISAGVYYFVVKQSAVGTELHPDLNIPYVKVSYFLQKDPKWSDIKIASSTQTIGQSGCLISCVASSLVKLGYNTDPLDLNERLSKVNGFEGASLIWYKLSEVFPKVSYRYSKSFNNPLFRIY